MENKWTCTKCLTVNNAENNLCAHCGNSNTQPPADENASEATTLKTIGSIFLGLGILAFLFLLVQGISNILDDRLVNPVIGQVYVGLAILYVLPASIFAWAVLRAISKIFVKLKNMEQRVL